MGTCHGNADDHCCYVAGEPCPFLEEGTVEGRRWACGLRRELGSWEAVIASDRYREHVKPNWIEGLCCSTWPDETLGQTCSTCGANQ